MTATFVWGEVGVSVDSGFDSHKVSNTQAKSVTTCTLTDGVVVEEDREAF